jgi:hypothetical protein
MGSRLTYKEEARTANINYAQAWVSCFVGQESSKFKVQFFVGSLVLKRKSTIQVYPLL